jgi:hypothetical protein
VKRLRRRRFGPACQASSALLLLILVGSRAPAETAPLSEKVILLQSTTASPLARKSMARIRDELSADRFDVIVADASAAGDLGAVVADAVPLAEVGTVLVLFGDPASGQTELCVVRRGARRTGVRRATIAADDPERFPEVLAKRALELLRATALELSIEVEPAPRAETPPEARPEAGIRAGATPQVLAPQAASVVVDMGVAMWNSVDGPPPAVAPVGRIALRLSDWIWARASVAGLGSRPHVATAHGSASLSQTAALLECAASFRRDKRIRPAFSLGAGVLNVQVAGTGAAPYEGRETQRWSLALDGGAGVAFAVGARSALVTELHALVASPHPVIRFVDTRAATVAYPSLILTLALRVAP